MAAGDPSCMHGKAFGTYCSICSWVPITSNSGWTTTYNYQWPPQDLIKVSQPVQQGWECPRCLRVYSPFIHTCLHCPEPEKTDTGDPVE